MQERRLQVVKMNKTNETSSESTNKTTAGDAGAGGEVSGEDGEEESALVMRFKWQVVEHSDTEIGFKLDFENPDEITEYHFGHEELSLGIVNKSSVFLQSQLSGKPLDAEMVDRGGKQALPAMVVSAAVGETIDELATKINSAALIGGILNIVFGILFDQSTKYTWTMMNTIQIMTYSSLVNINYPAIV